MIVKGGLTLRSLCAAALTRCQNGSLLSVPFAGNQIALCRPAARAEKGQSGCNSEALTQRGVTYGQNRAWSARARNEAWSERVRSACGSERVVHDFGTLLVVDNALNQTSEEPGGRDISAWPGHQLGLC